MNDKPSPKDKFFFLFEESTVGYTFPETFVLDNKPHPLALLAANHLQQYLKTQTDWEHNFGLCPGQQGIIIGKMFGVLVAKNLENEIGYLAAFSGKLAGGNQHKKFVPPVFDGLSEQSFVNQGMGAITLINIEIKTLDKLTPPGYEDQVKLLKSKRRKHSNLLQKQIFDRYFFLNQAGVKKSLTQIFRKASYKNPPAGAGECAGPKLLQYAFQHKMKPIVLTEFWWGLSPKSDQWKHGHFYPCCKEKCGPILDHMLEGLIL